MAGQMLIGVVLVYGPEQVEAFRQEVFADLDGVVMVSGEPIPGAIPPSSVRGFNAGANRDIGIAEARRRYPGCSVVLIDGDCIPGPSWTQAHRTALDTTLPVVACGVRMDHGMDPRSKPLDWQGVHYGPSIRTGGYVPQLVEILAHRATWTCNLSMNNAALTLLESVCQSIHGVQRIFAPMFDGCWGGEDTGLGVLAWHAGCQIVTLDPEESFVVHTPHPTRITSTRNLRKVDEYCSVVRKYFGFHSSPCYIQPSTPSRTEDAPPKQSRTPMEPTTCPAELLEELRELEAHAQGMEAEATKLIEHAKTLRHHASARATKKLGLTGGQSLDLATGKILTEAPATPVEGE